MKNSCLVTGASGFVGRHVCAALAASGYSVRMALRRALKNGDSLQPLGESAVVGDIDATTDWSSALAGIDAVVHLANRAHVMREHVADPLALYRRINTDGTRRLAEQAAAAGVRRLVYVSSVKVMGEATPGAPFRETDRPAPADPYAVSKLEAEQAVREIASATGLEATILRPPLVYGPGVGANFLRLMRWVAKGIPLPLAAIANRRSMIYVGNLASCIEACIRHPDAAGKIYLVADGEPMSTPALIARLARALAVPDRSWPLPPGLLIAGASLLGKGETVRRLAESLEIDDRTIRRELGWTPPYSAAVAMQATADWFAAAKRVA